MDSCKKCNEPLCGNYCSVCGYPATQKKIDKHYIIQEIRDLLCANKEMAYTIKKTFISPGESVRQFITGDRYRFVKPISFLLVSSLIYVLVSNLFHVGTDKYFNVSVGDSMVSFIIIKILGNIGYLNITIGIFVAFWAKMFFKKSGYNIFEIFILFCFVIGITMLFYSVVAVIQWATHLKLIQLSFSIGGVYIAWAIGQFFDRKRATSYIKAFLSYWLGLLSLAILVSAAILIEFAIKR